MLCYPFLAKRMEPVYVTRAAPSMFRRHIVGGSCPCYDYLRRNNMPLIHGVRVGLRCTTLTCWQCLRGVWERYVTGANKDTGNDAARSK